MAIDVHNWDSRLRGIVRHIEEDPRITPRNRELILQYKVHMIASGLSMARVVRKLYDLKFVCQRYLPAGKDFDTMTVDEMKPLVAQIEMTKYSENTKCSFKVTLKTFYRWLRGGNDIPPEVAWFRVSVKNNKAKLPEEMLTEEEVQKLISAEPHSRQRALISVLYESGCRIGELLSLRIKNISFDEYGCQLLVHGKTGYRRIRIIGSVPYLLEWLNSHPKKDDPESPLWCRFKSARPVNYAIIRQLFIETAKRAGIVKKVNPHNFRHSRATKLAKHLTEAQMKEYLGWVQGSDMAAVYVHLSGRDVDSALFQMYGMKANEKKDDTKLKPKTCAQCQESNGFANKFCRRCGNELREQEELVKEHIKRSEADGILDKMLNDPGFKRLFSEAMKKALEAEKADLRPTT